MEKQLEKQIKKFNRIYVIELFVIAAVVITLATLKLLNILGNSQNFHHVFNAITAIAATYIIIDFVWLCFSKPRQKRNSWFDKISLLPFAISLLVFDIICFIKWNEEISYYSLFVSIVFYYIAAIYIAQGVYHLAFKPAPSIVEAATQEFNKQKENERVESEVRSLIKKVLGRGAKILCPLKGGMMNISYIVRNSKGKKYVVYISTEQANEMVDRPLEKEHQKIASDLGLTSKNVYFDTERGIKINEYIGGTSIDKVEDIDYQKVADLFKKFHASKKLSKADYNPFDRFVNSYEKEALEFSKDLDPKYKELRTFLFRYRKYLESQKKTLCHNDAQRSNIVRDLQGNYFLIDFEFVGNNDPIYDIGTFGNAVVSEGRKLLDYYFEKPTKDEIKRYYLWRIYISLQWYNVAIVKHYRGEGKAHGFDFLAVAKHFLVNASDAYNGFNDELK